MNHHNAARSTARNHLAADRTISSLPAMPVAARDGAQRMVRHGGAIRRARDLVAVTPSVRIQPSRCPARQVGRQRGHLRRCVGQVRALGLSSSLTSSSLRALLDGQGLTVPEPQGHAANPMAAATSEGATHRPESQRVDRASDLAKSEDVALWSLGIRPCPCVPLRLP